MKITKRNGELQNLSLNKILYRIRKACNDKKFGKLKNIDPDFIAQKVVNRLYDEIHTSEIDELTSQITISMATENPEYSAIASRIIISNMHKKTGECFSEIMEQMYNNVDNLGDSYPLVSERFIHVVRKYKDILNFEIDYDRDYILDYFGYKTLEKSYLTKIHTKNSVKIIERPQHMFMRVAIGIHFDDLESIKDTYHYMSQGYFTHATPTLFNAGSNKSQLSSCFLLSGSEDSIDSIYKNISDCAKISKWAGGIGVHISGIRAKGSRIRGTNGLSDGIIPMLKVYNNTARYVNQCFTGDTIIYTKNGPVEIKDIQDTDYVITIDGSYKKVNEKITNDISKEILEIKTTNSINPLRVTKEHEIYVIKNQSKMLNYNVIKNRIEKGIIKPEFIKASEITENDLVCFPKLKTNEIIGIDNNFAKFIGIMIGDGYISYKSNEYSVTLSDYTKLHLQQFVKNYLENKGISFKCYKNIGCTQIKWYKNEKISLLREDLYNKDEKYIRPELLNEFSEENLYSLLYGLIYSDGHIGKEIYYYTSSEKLAYQIRYVCYKLGILTSGSIKNNIGKSHITKDGRYIETKKLSYVLRIPKTKNLSKKLDIKASGYLKYLDYDGKIWGRIKYIKPINFSGKVYDLNIEDNHNYLTDKGLVHNSGKRNGSFAIYIEPWHADILEFLDLKKNHGNEEERARDLFYALWVPDLFMEKVDSDDDWYLMCPDESPGLNEAYSTEFNELYERYITEGKYRKKIKARDVWNKIVTSQTETGTPYILYKDAVNKKSNQENLGTIKSSNLCSEIVLFTSKEECAVCFTSDTKIVTKNGIKRIDECDGEFVLSYFDNDKNLKKEEKFVKAKLLDNGVKDVYELNFYGNSSLKVTENHPILVRKSYNYNTKKNTYEWKKAMDLNEDDYIIRPTITPIPGYNDTNSNIVEYLTAGWMIGDGWQSCDKNGHITYGVCFGPTDEYARDTVIKQSVEWANNVPYVKGGHHKSNETYYKDKNGVYNWNSSKQNFVKFINDKFGFKVSKAGNKEISSKIMDRSPSEIASFLSGLFSADGSVYFRKPVTRGYIFYISYSSSSRKLLNDIQNILRLFGIQSRIVFGLVKSRGTFQGKLIIEQNDSIKRFAKNINFNLSPSKKEKLDINLNLIEKQLIRSTVKDYVKLKSKIFIGQEKVYDLNVPESHNFIAEGIVVHNCNLGSIALPKYIKQTTKKFSLDNFDFELLGKVTKLLTRNLDKVIDENFYPIPEAKKSNMSHRPIGIGVQGLADTYMKLRLPFESEEASLLNKRIFETIQYNAIEASCEMAQEKGKYKSYEGSPISRGIFQHNMWDIDESSLTLDWQGLREKIKIHGTRNSMLTALMPTASTAQILGNSEAFEPIQSNIFMRRTLSGEFPIVNKFLVNDLFKLGLWSKETRDELIKNGGSIRNIPGIPEEIKELYKTVWEISQKNIINQSADRAIFIDQTQSMNLYLADPTYRKITSMQFYAWRKGLKTGQYYLRTKAAQEAVQITIEPSKPKEVVECTDEICVMCSG